MRLTRTLPLAFLAVLAAAGIAAACPNCAAALDANRPAGSDGSLAAGYARSTALLLSLPFVIAGTLGWQCRALFRSPPPPEQDLRPPS